MDSKGVKLHFLGIIQVLNNYFYIKNHFLFIFPGFSNLLDWAHNIQRRVGAMVQNDPRLIAIPQWTAG
jgi:hypothetical protein